MQPAGFGGSVAPSRRAAGYSSAEWKRPNRSIPGKQHYIFAHGVERLQGEDLYRFDGNGISFPEYAWWKHLFRRAVRNFLQRYNTTKDRQLKSFNGSRFSSTPFAEKLGARRNFLLRNKFFPQAAQHSRNFLPDARQSHQHSAGFVNLFIIFCYDRFPKGRKDLFEFLCKFLYHLDVFWVVS